MARWPVPALLTWALSWGIWLGGVALGLPAWLALAGALAWSMGSALRGDTPWRRGWMALGFPLSLALSGTGLAGVAPAWVWLLPLLLLLLLYPLNAWRDAPLFPTPHDALQALPEVLALAPGAQILDAGCGLGDGLLALRRAYPQARLSGIEWSWPLRALCALRCPWARVRQGDIWLADWSSYDLVYLFQRPESMTRAVAQARVQLRPGAWLVSLEFEATELTPLAVLATQQGRKVWVYQMASVKA